MKTIKLISVILFTLGMNYSNAYDNKSFVIGEIQYEDGTKEKGHLLIKDVVSNSDHIVFKHADGKVVSYDANDLMGYSSETHNYISQHITNKSDKRVFMKEVHNGKTKLYIHYIHDARPFVKKNSDKKVYLHEDDFHHDDHNIRYAFYIKRAQDTHFVRLHKKKYKWQLADFFGPKKVWDFVHDHSFDYHKVAHLVEYFNDRHKVKQPKF